jgi:hypothetical protein
MKLRSAQPFPLKAADATDNLLAFASATALLTRSRARLAADQTSTCMLAWSRRRRGRRRKEEEKHSSFVFATSLRVGPEAAAAAAADKSMLYARAYFSSNFLLTAAAVFLEVT